MKLLAWNLNHKASERRLKAGLVEVLEAVAPDIVVLTEYVHGQSREPLVDALAHLGLGSLRVSVRASGNNQVLIAARYLLESGDLAGPVGPDPAAASNFLHVKVPELAMEVVGLRAPAYKRPSVLRQYWDELAPMIAATSTRRIVYAGDLNADPDGSAHLASPVLSGLRNAGWQLPAAAGTWSHTSRARLDHALLAPGLPPATAEYLTSVGGIVLAARGDRTAVSDHAALLLHLPDSGPSAQVATGGPDVARAD